MNVLLVAYDNDSYIHWFPSGLAYIASALLAAGHEVEVYNQDLHHYPDSHLTSFLDRNKFDVIGVGVIGGYYQYRKLLLISEAINCSKQRPFFIIGGHGPAPEPEFFMKKTMADAICIGESEITIVELLDTLENKRSLESVQGIAYNDSGTIMRNVRRPVVKDVDLLPMPAYHLFPMEYYRLMRFANCSPSDFVLPLLSGRGCPFTCNFCYRMDEGFRPRSSASVIAEIEFLKINYGITYIYFFDELLMSSMERTMAFCEDLIKAKVNIKWSCMGRLNFALPEVLQLMKNAGCVFINYGIEAMDDQILKNMKKVLTTKQIVAGIEATIATGISPGFNIIFGNIGENRDTLQKGVDFLLKYDDGAQLRTIRPVTPYPGSPLYYHAIESGLMKDVEDFYENKHTNSDLLSVNFTELTDEEFHEALMEANNSLLNNYFEKRKCDAIAMTTELYHNKNRNFRGFRTT